MDSKEYKDTAEVRVKTLDRDGRYTVDVEPAHKYDPDAGDNVIHDAVFGDMHEGGPNYKAVGGIASYVLITKANLGLGILSIPFVFHMVGIVPGIILIVVMHCIVTYLLITVASGIVSISTALNALSGHGACTAVFIAVSAGVGLLLGSFRTLSSITWIGWVGLFSLLVAVLTMTVSVGIQNRPAAAPQTGPWDKDLRIFAKPTFSSAMTAVDTVLFSYGATPCYFNIVSEMRDPRYYVRSLVASTATCTLFYLLIGGIVYGFCGQYVSSPALGSAGVLMKKVSYGLALPAICCTAIIYGHMLGKHAFVRLLAGTRHLTTPTRTHWLTWAGCMAGGAALSYILASAIPNFGAIISLGAALVDPFVVIGTYNLMWWHDNWRFAAPSERAQPQRIAGAVLNAGLFVVGIFIFGAGTYGAVNDLISSKSNSKPWSCADNSNSIAADA